MFIPLSTTKGEKISVNVDKVVFLAETKRGTSLVLEDGTLIDLSETYAEILCRFPFLSESK